MEKCYRFNADASLLFRAFQFLSKKFLNVLLLRGFSLENNVSLVVESSSEVKEYIHNNHENCAINNQNNSDEARGNCSEESFHIHGIDEAEDSIIDKNELSKRIVLKVNTFFANKKRCKKTPIHELSLKNLPIVPHFEKDEYAFISSDSCDFVGKKSNSPHRIMGAFQMMQQQTPMLKLSESNVKCK